MMKRLTLLLWVAGLFILGLSSLHAQTGGPFLPSAADTGAGNGWTPCCQV